MRFKKINHSIVTALRKYGIVVTRLSSSPEGRLGCLLKTYNIEIVLDVGANIGQYAKMLRQELDYDGIIHSFEPMKSEYFELQKTARNDPKWKVDNCGLGDVDAEMVINIAGNSASSSLLAASKRLLSVAPQVAYVGNERVQIHKLDTIYNEQQLKGQRVFLKIDAQGYESKILRGAKQSLQYIDTLQLEMALTPMYEDELLFEDYFSMMHANGYYFVHLMPGLWDTKTGELLEVDGIFHRYSPNNESEIN